MSLIAHRYGNATILLLKKLCIYKRETSLCVGVSVRHLPCQPFIRLTHIFTRGTSEDRRECSVDCEFGQMSGPGELYKQHFWGPSNQPAVVIWKAGVCIPYKSLLTVLMWSIHTYKIITLIQKNIKWLIQEQFVDFLSCHNNKSCPAAAKTDV